jgi:hypothetical protein
MKLSFIALLLASQGVPTDSRTVHVRNKSGFTLAICVNGLTHTVQKGDSTKFPDMPKVINGDLTYAYSSYNDKVLWGYPTRQALHDTNYFVVTKRNCDGTCNPALSEATSKISWTRASEYEDGTEGCNWVCPPTEAPTMAPVDSMGYENITTQTNYLRK